MAYSQVVLGKSNRRFTVIGDLVPHNRRESDELLLSSKRELDSMQDGEDYVCTLIDTSVRSKELVVSYGFVPVVTWEGKHCNNITMYVRKRKK